MLKWVDEHPSGYLVAHPTNRKWVITPVISGLTLLIPFITGVITHLLSGMSHQVHSNDRLPCSPEPWFIMVYFREIIPFYGRKIQVSELL